MIELEAWRSRSAGVPWSERGFYGPATAPVLVVGEAPNQRMQRAGTFHHAVMRPDLAELAAVDFPAGWFRLFARTNLLGTWPGRAPSGKGDAFDRGRARVEARRIAGAFGGFGRVVLLGRRVQEAFGDHAPRGWFVWRWSPELGTKIAASPHPSRVSTWWNDPENRARASAFWREVGTFARRVEVLRAHSRRRERS